MKPKIYISSTIYDFADLRSSLKYVLEELGYTVFLSEFNDFKKPLDENSYNACLAVLEEVDYFLLLIGQRTGGLFDANQGISITRMEYRTAYELARTRHLKLLTFVRKSLWDIREDRKSLVQFFKESEANSKELSDDLRIKLFNHPSAFVNEAEMTFAFIKEVTRIDEMKAAIKGAANFPVGNWVHTFLTFEDVMAALNGELNIKNPLRQEVLATNLRNELVGNLMALLSKKRGKIVATSDFFPTAARKCLSPKLDGVSQITGKRLRWLGMYLLFCAPTSRLTTQFLDEALISGEFLLFTKKAYTFEPSPLHDAMLGLKANIDRLRFLAGSFAEQRAQLAQELMHAPDDDTPVQIENKRLVVAFAIQDCEQNIVILSSSILKHLKGDQNALQAIRLNPESPFADTVKENEQERPTRAETLKWAESQL